MRCSSEKEGPGASLLFFFLILVMIFCKPGMIGCENDRCGEEPACGC